VNELTESERLALHEALDNEYRAWATYDRVTLDFSDAPHFEQLRAIEVEHITALQQLFERYAQSAPQNRWVGNVPHYGSVCEACEAGADAAGADAALYARLRASTRRGDILEVFKRLEAEAGSRKLRALQRCEPLECGQSDLPPRRLARARGAANRSN
jgi:hypothetical protein